MDQEYGPKEDGYNYPSGFIKYRCTVGPDGVMLKTLPKIQPPWPKAEFPNLIRYLQKLYPEYHAKLLELKQSRQIQWYQVLQMRELKRCVIFTKAKDEFLIHRENHRNNLRAWREAFPREYQMYRQYQTQRVKLHFLATNPAMVNQDAVPDSDGFDSD